jgi:hypothetical protein
LIVREITIGLAHGFVEFGAMIATFLLLNKLFTRTLGIDILVLAVREICFFVLKNHSNYFFIVCSTALLGSATSFLKRTRLLPSSTRVFRFWVIFTCFSM